MSDGDAKPAGLEVGVPANDAPARRRFRDAEIDRILRTAAELQERSHQVAAEAGRGLTLEELRQIATEAGIDPRFVDAAASQSRAPVKQEGSGFAGGPYSWHYRSSIEGEINDADREFILHAIRVEMGLKGDVNDVFGRMEWSCDDGTGPIIIGVSSRDGTTEIDVSATKKTEVSMIYALGIPSGGMIGGVAVSGLLGISGLTALPLIAAMSGVSYGAARLAWKLRSRWWDHRLKDVMESVNSLVRDAARDGARDAARDGARDGGRGT